MTDVTGDADLLALCAHLRVLQTGWQRLWDATSGVPDGEEGPADLILDRYTAWVWPAVRLADVSGLTSAADPVRMLLDLPATTPEGLRAKAAAVLALHDAGDYSDRDRADHWQIVAAVLRDAAGAAAMPLGNLYPHCVRAWLYAGLTPSVPGRLPRYPRRRKRGVPPRLRLTLTR